MDKFFPSRGFLSMLRSYQFYALALLCLFLQGCAVPPVTQPAPAPAVAPAPVDPHLAAGDSIDISVSGEADLSGVYIIAADGTIRMPLVGALKLSALLPDEAAAVIARAYAQGYLVRPEVKVTRRMMTEGGCLRLPVCAP